jgi:hypothetical protein
MPKLTELVKLRTDLINISEKISIDEKILDKIYFIESIKENNIEYNEINSIIDGCQEMRQQDQNIQDRVKFLISDLETKIDLIIQENRDIVYHQFSIVSENRTILVDDESDNIVQHRVNFYSGWKYPGLQLNCKNKKFIDLMVSCDPLYLVYAHKTKIKQLISEYSEIYQKRLRLYNIVDITRDTEFNYKYLTYSEMVDKDTNEEFIDATLGVDLPAISRSLLPQNQFGLVLCWETLNFVGLAKIESYLKEVFHLLRPGGTFMFSYNNCDLFGSARLAEQNEMGYCNSRILKTLCEEIGYVTKFEDRKTGDAYFTHVSWAEISKPGVLTSAKATQVLGEIILN